MGPARNNFGGVTSKGSLLASGPVPATPPRREKSCGMKRLGSGSCRPEDPPSPVAACQRTSRSLPTGSTLKAAPYHRSFTQPLLAEPGSWASAAKAELVRKTMHRSGRNSARYSATTSGFHSSTANGPRNACLAGYLCSDIAAERAKSSGVGASSLCAKAICCMDANSRKVASCGPARRTRAMYSKTRASTSSRLASPSGVSEMFSAKSWLSEKACEGPAESWSTHARWFKMSCNDPRPSWPSTCAM
mmetsp:Transcript_25699/g.81110  ORF Transcript_25699/g.81110 Transcript_25699/m.81110 type:complete len:247 (+) Transcript_25699:872-1612(+)